MISSSVIITKKIVPALLSAVVWHALRLLNLVKRPSYWPRLVVIPTDFVGKHIIANGIFEQEELVLLKEYVLSKYVPLSAEQIFLDIGANIGNHTCYLAPLFRQSIAFEPNPTIASILRANITLNSLLNKVTIMQIGLSDCEEVITYYQNASDNFGGGGFDPQVSTRTNFIEMQLPVFIADNVLTNEVHLQGKVGFVKIDVEGLEDRVVAGLLQTIRRDCPVIAFEAQNGDLARKVINLLKDVGYSNFYRIIGDIDAERPILIRWFLRIFHGGKRSGVIKIEHFDNRYYEMILALPPNAA